MQNCEGRIERVEKARFLGERWRDIGCNARKGWHGKTVYLDLVRITIDGETGFGWSSITKDHAEKIVGTPLREMFNNAGRIRSEYRSIEYPLLDWWGRMKQLPVYALVAGDEFEKENAPTLNVPCYDTTLYFNDLHLREDSDAVPLMQEKALEGWNRGYRAFKIKVGRGARHMPLLKGIKRDIEIIRGIREALGSKAEIMIDANNSYNLNIAKEVLYATADAHLIFIEEPFYEDPILYEDLKNWMDKEKIPVLIADGEGLTAAPALVDWAKQGFIDVIQYDIRFYGFNKLLELEDRLKGSKVMQAPHNYGGPYGNYASCHIAPAMERFLTVEWDEVKVNGLDAPGYTLVEGKIRVPNSPGFGLHLDDDHFAKAVQESGWQITLNL
ncbi:mandelate racemase/muconate lactonizing enzyme family protein [Ammoniphilus sp. 3BR4]|uniref:mandelate racemase/muconate lactonizing enzyme family protein n=1 Tax=Ammoniphilus sp. 3BR4 TaxID=3158265 RepID=UPI00346777CC